MSQELLSAVSRTISLTVSSDSGRFSNEAAVSILSGPETTQKFERKAQICSQVFFSDAVSHGSEDDEGLIQALHAPHRSRALVSA